MFASSHSKRTASAQGFTLLEVLVAFVILALSLGAILQLFSNGFKGERRATDYTAAIELAKSRLALLEREGPLAEGEQSGGEEIGFKWASIVSRLDVYGEDENFGDKTSGPVPYKVDVTVFWNESGRDRSFTLTTLRLALPE